MMNRAFWRLLIVVAIIQAISGIGFALHVPFVTELWQSIVPGATPLSVSFVGSIFAAAAASTLWCAVSSREEGALTGIALDYLAIFVPLSIFGIQIGTAEGRSAPVLFGAACAIGIVFGAALLYLSRKIQIRQTLPQPRLVRLSFIVFIIALLIVGGGMVLKIPNIMPWSLSPAESVIYGWMFLGAAAYFTYSILYPSWGNSGGQLAGFLAYDVVLIFPFVARFGTTIPQQFVMGHIIYTTVVTYSGLLAIYYLFVYPETRLIRQRASGAAAIS